MPTLHKFIGVAFIFALFLIGVVFRLPSFVTPVLAVVGGVFYVWYVLRTQSQRAEQRTEPPTSESFRLYAALKRANIPREAVTWVSGVASRPFIKKKGNHLLISASMVDQLTDDELVAMVQQVWLVHPAAYWIELARTPGPWLMVAGILGQLFYRFAPLFTVGGFIWTIYSNASGKVTKAVALKNGRTFLAHGGVMADLLSALTKNYTALLENVPQNRDSIARTANKVFRVLAGLVAITDGQLVDIIKTAGGASVLLHPPAAPKFWTKQSPYFPLFRMILIWTLLLGGSVYLALSLGR